MAVWGKEHSMWEVRQMIQSHRVENSYLVYFMHTRIFQKLFCKVFTTITFQEHATVKDIDDQKLTSLFAILSFVLYVLFFIVWYYCHLMVIWMAKLVCSNKMKPKVFCKVQRFFFSFECEHFFYCAYDQHIQIPTHSNCRSLTTAIIR